MTKKGHNSNDPSQSLDVDFKNLPRELQEKLLQQARPQSKQPSAVHFGVEQQIARSAPLPDPNELQGYEQILPGAFERILKLHEDTSRGKLELFNKELDNQRFLYQKNFELTQIDLLHNTKNETRGQWMAFCVAMPIILLIGLAIYTHASTEIILGLAAIFTVGNLGAIFVTRHLEKQSQDIALEKSSQTKNND